MSAEEALKKMTFLLRACCDRQLHHEREYGARSEHLNGSPRNAAGLKGLLDVGYWACGRGPGPHAPGCASPGPNQRPNAHATFHDEGDPRDVIVQIGDKAIDDVPSLGDALVGKNAGEVVSVQVYRGNQQLAANVTTR